MTPLRTLSVALALAAFSALSCGQKGVADTSATDEAGADDGGTDTTDARSPDLSGIPLTNDVQLIVEPNGQAGAEIVAAITAARTSVHLTMYLLSDTDVINALIERARARVDVKVVLNKTFPVNSIDQTSVFNTLQRGGVKIVWAPSGFTYTHEKCLIIDGAAAWIMTMNFANSSPTFNREYIVIDSDREDVAEAEAIFAADYANQAIAPSGKLLVAPTNAQPLLIQMANTALRSIDVQADAYSDSYVTDALLAAKARGIIVRLVIAKDATPSSAQAQSIARLKAANIPVVAAGPEAGSSASSANPNNHAKAMLVDGTRAYVGSANFTINSLRYNRELGVILGEPAALQTLSDTFEADFRRGVAQ